MHPKLVEEARSRKSGNGGLMGFLCGRGRRGEEEYRGGMPSHSTKEAAQDLVATLTAQKN